MDYQGPKMEDDRINAKTLQKTNKRVAEIIAKYQIGDKPVLCDVDTFGWSEWNRKKGKPNVQYIHRTLFEKITGSEGFDPNKLQHLMAIEYESPKLRKTNVDHNTMLTKLTPGCLPPVMHEKMNKATFAGSHIRIAVGCFKHNIVSPVTKQAFRSECEYLATATKTGLWAWLFKDTIPGEDVMLLSEWRNSDQNQNLINSEVSLIRAIQEISDLVSCSASQL